MSWQRDWQKKKISLCVRHCHQITYCEFLWIPSPWRICWHCL